MRSTVQALCWELLWRGRWTLIFFWLIAFLPMLIYISLIPLNIKDNDPVKLILQVAFIPAIIFVVALGVVVAQRPIARLYSKPISNLSIAAWHVGSGAALLAIQILVVTIGYNSLFNGGWPVVGPVVFAAVAWAVAQPFFCLASRSITKAALTGSPLIIMLAWLMSHWGLFEKQKPRNWSDLHAMEYVLLAGVFLLFFALTVRSVALDRCGESSKRTRIWVWLGSFFDRLLTWPTPDRPYRSMKQAQFWYEWKMKGLTLPFAIAFLGGYAAIAITVQNWGSIQRVIVALHHALFVASALISFFGAICGLWFGCSIDFMTNSAGRRREMGVKSSADSMSGFLATRPITDTAIARNILKVCFASLLTTITMWLVAYASIRLVAWGMQISSAELWVNIKISWRETAALLGTAWLTTSNAATITLSGRTKQFSCWIVGCLLTLAAVMIVLEWQYGNYAIDNLFKIVFTIASLLLVAFTIWAFWKSVNRKLISKGEVVGAAVIAVAIAGMCFAFLPFEPNFARSMLVVDCSILSVLAWATAPLAVNWNRHR